MEKKNPEHFLKNYSELLLKKFSVWFGDPQGSKKAISAVINALTTEQGTKLKKNSRIFFKSLLSSMYDFMIIEAIEKELAILLTC